MTPRPLHRWKSLWAGILVLVFLGWSWGRSLHHLDGVLWMAARFHFSAAQTTGRVELAWAASSGAWGETFLWIHEAAATAGEPHFPKAVNWETYPGKFQLTVAHWLLILLFVCPWTAFLVWRQIGHKRLTAGSRTNAGTPTSNVDS